MGKLSHAKQLELLQDKYDYNIEEVFDVSENFMVLRYEENFFDKITGRVLSKTYFKLASYDGSNFTIGKTKYDDVCRDAKDNVICLRKVLGFVRVAVFDQNGNKIKIKRNELD